MRYSNRRIEHIALGFRSELTRPFIRWISVLGDGEVRGPPDHCCLQRHNTLLTPQRQMFITFHRVHLVATVSHVTMASLLLCTVRGATLFLDEKVDRTHHRQTCTEYAEILL